MVQGDGVVGGMIVMWRLETWHGVNDKDDWEDCGEGGYERLYGWVSGSVWRQQW